MQKDEEQNFQSLLNSFIVHCRREGLLRLFVCRLRSNERLRKKCLYTFVEFPYQCLMGKGQGVKIYMLDEF